MSDDVFRLVDIDGFESLVDDLLEFDGNDHIVIGSLSESTREYDAGDDLLRVADFVFPGEAFGVPERSISDLDASLLTSGLTAAEYLDADSDVVYSPTEYKERAREVANAYADPVFLIGIWSPNRNWRMTGNPDNAKPRRLSRMQYPERAFDTAKGCAPLKEMSLTIQGTVVVERELLSLEASEFVDGDRDELHIKDRNPEMLDADEVQDLVANLSPGDEVEINDRSRALEVIPESESECFPTTADVNVFLRSHGNHYRISFSESESSHPRLKWSSDSEYITELEIVSTSEPAGEPVEA